MWIVGHLCVWITYLVLVSYRSFTQLALRDLACNVGPHEHRAINAQLLPHHLADELGAIRPDAHALGQRDRHRVGFDVADEAVAYAVHELMGGAKHKHLGTPHGLQQVRLRPHVIAQRHTRQILVVVIIVVVCAGGVGLDVEGEINGECSASVSLFVACPGTIVTSRTNELGL